MRSFYGLCSYYRRFVQGFAQITRPLHILCEKNTKFLWSVELKQRLTDTRILAYPLPNLGSILDTNASDKAVGRVLSQVQDGSEKVIAYMIKAMNKHEQYCVTRKELLAVITSLKSFHSYYGKKYSYEQTMLP